MNLLAQLQALDAERPTETKDQIECLIELKEVARLAASIATELSTALAKGLDERGMKVESFGRYTIQKEWKAKRRWDDSALLARVLQYAEENGYEAHATLRRVAAFSYWRIGELGKLGFDHRHFCDEEWSAPTVTVVQGGSAEGHPA